jgi:hypothetical protein
MATYTIAQGETKDEIRSTDATNTIDNSGLIWGHGPNGVLREAIWLSGGTSATIRNRASGVIEAQNAPAVFISANTAAIENAGLIQALSPGQNAIRASLNTNSDTTVVTNTGRITAGENGDAIVLTNTGSGKLKVLNSGQIDGGVDAARLENSGTITRLGSADLMLSAELRNSGTITTAQINGTATIVTTGAITADAISAKSLNVNTASATVNTTISIRVENISNMGTINGGALMEVTGLLDNSETLSAGRINTAVGALANDLTLDLRDGHGVIVDGVLTTGILDTHELANTGTVNLRYAGGNNVPSAASGFFGTELSDILVVRNLGTINADVIHGGELYNYGTLTLTGATMGAGVGVATEFQKITNLGGNFSPTNAVINGDITGDVISNSGLINGVVTLKDINGDGQTRYEANGGYGGARVKGTSGLDSMTGSYSSDTLEGGGGNDYLDGNHGSDLIKGEGGNDTLSSASGNDTLDGGSGSDKLYFNPMGNQMVKGGSGTDQFHFQLAGMTTGDCKILDFANGSEKIRIYVNDETAWDTFAELRAIMVQTDADTVTIDFERAGGQGSLAIDGVTLAQMDTSDFIFI